MGSIRVLHVVGSLRPGGVETWLLHLLRRIDRSRFELDFLVHDATPCLLEPELVALGARIHRCPHVRRPARYAARFGRILREHGPFDAVHSHVHAFSGFVLGLAARHRVPLRIAHSHTTTERRAFLRAPWRSFYEAAMRRAIGSLATHGLACAEAPARDLFGPAWRADPRWQVLHCGIEPALYEVSARSALARASLGLGEKERVVGHVGNFHAVKNHPFLLHAFAALLELEPEAALVCVGEGPALGDVRAVLRRRGIADRVRLLGVRRDVPALMREVFDVFVLPSRLEGLPLALVEAQAAQLPCVVSDVVTREADVPGSTIVRLPLASGAGAWGRAILDLARRSGGAGRAARSPVAGTAFDIATGAERLAALYSGA
jgi:glycosyltransferase involved in cell wall biosynthesis